MHFLFIFLYLSFVQVFHIHNLLRQKDRSIIAPSTGLQHCGNANLIEDATVIDAAHRAQVGLLIITIIIIVFMYIRLHY